MTHIPGMHDSDLHDENGFHIKPVYRAPAERLPGNPDHAHVLGTAVRGGDLERAQEKYVSALNRYKDHLVAHKQ